MSKRRQQPKVATPPVLKSVRPVQGLKLTRFPGQQILIGDDITISFVESHGKRTGVVIDAPVGVPILRAELMQR